MRALRSAAEPRGSCFDSSVGCDWEEVCAYEGIASASASVIPAKAGIQPVRPRFLWVPESTGTTAMFILVLQFFQLALRLGGEDGKVASARAHHRLLRVVAQDVAQEFAQLWRHGLPRRAVDEHGDDAGERIAVVHDARFRRRDEVTAVVLR